MFWRRFWRGALRVTATRNKHSFSISFGIDISTCSSREVWGCWGRDGVLGRWPVGCQFLENLIKNKTKYVGTFRLISGQIQMKIRFCQASEYSRIPVDVGMKRPAERHFPKRKSTKAYVCVYFSRFWAKKKTTGYSIKCNGLERGTRFSFLTTQKRNHPNVLQLFGVVGFGGCSFETPCISLESSVKRYSMFIWLFEPASFPLSAKWYNWPWIISKLFFLKK